jgi:pseudouridine-5'-phosphate glycosidase
MYYINISSVGLSEQELDGLAQIGHKARKTSRRDIAYAISKVCTISL